MKIKKVRLKNFKGWANLEFDFGTNNKAVLYGKSGSGKSSILEAFKFVLGLNSKEPYPQIEDEQTGGLNFIKDLEVVVEFVLDKNGVEYNLKRTAIQKYKTNKETGEKEWAGWEANNFEIDGVAMNSTLYKENIAQLFGVAKYEYLDFLIDSFYFNTDTAKWNWKNRQQILYKVMQVDSALEELKNDDRFILIKEHLDKNRTTTEILKIINAEKKIINENREKNEILLNEKTNELLEYNIDFEALYKQKEQLEKDIETENQLLAVQTNESIILEIKKQIQDIQNQIVKHNIEYNNKRNNAMLDLQKHKNTLENIRVAISREESELARLSKEWKELNSKEWLGDTICPTCKRALEEHLINEAKSHFEKEKNTKLEELKDEILKLRDSVSKNKELYTTKLVQVNSLENEVLQIKPSEEVESLQSQLQDLTNRLNAINTENVGIDYTKINRLKEELRQVNEKLAFKTVKENIQRRIAELKQEQIDLTNKEILNAKTRRVFEEYTLAIIDKVNHTVNAGFDGISWLLFDTHTANAENAISETCELLYKGTPYSALSSGERVQANFLTVKGLQDNFGVNLPIFVDEVAISTGFNREANQQIIELKTTEGDDTNLNGLKIRDVYGKEATYV